MANTNKLKKMVSERFDIKVKDITVRHEKGSSYGWVVVSIKTNKSAKQIEEFLKLHDRELEIKKYFDDMQSNNHMLRVNTYPITIK